jgi:uncharacterized protein with HEPN domain
MLDHAREALSFVQGKTRADLDSDRQLNLALVRLLEIIGEAASRVPQAERFRHSDIPWAPIISMRNHLIHGYGRVNLDIVWQVAIQDLPPLIAALEKVLPSPETDGVRHAC